MITQEKFNKAIMDALEAQKQAKWAHAFMREARWLSMYGKTWGKK